MKLYLRSIFGIFFYTLLSFFVSSFSFASPATDCTIFVSPAGGGNGATISTPTTLSNAVTNLIIPGSVVCLLPGTYRLNVTNGPFEIDRAGTPTAWITFKSYDTRAVIAPSAGQYDLFQIYRGSYIQIQNIEFDGRDSSGTIVASNAIACKGPGHHVKAINNYIHDMGRGGIVSYTSSATNPDESTSNYFCDYMTIDRNIFYHNGYSKGWSSAISLNNDQIPRAWFDNAPGFHSFITNNIISGTFDKEGNPYSTPPGQITDGNGIIIDLGGNQKATPPVLIANNVVYENGGRCIHTLNAGNAWIVNNTCYKNGLDLRVPVSNDSNFGEYIYCGSSNNVLVNNIAYGWNGRRIFSDEQCGMAGFSLGSYSRNLYYSSGTVPTISFPRLNDPTMLKYADPLFQVAPVVNPTADGQYATALNPNSLTNQFYLQPASPAIGAGIDPTTLTSDSALITGLQQYVFSDIEGKPRTRASWDIGAYQSSTQPTATPTPTPTVLHIDMGTNTPRTDPANLQWSADQGCSNGQMLDRGPISIAGTADPRLYQTERYGMTNCLYQVQNGTYMVKLHFAETYSGITGPGQRVFDVSVGGQTLKGLDVYSQAGGPNIALIKTFSNVQVSNQQLPITFTSQIENPEINGIEIIPQKGKLGDVTNDGRVTIYDYNQIIRDFGKTGPGIVSDIDQNQVVDLQDYLIMVQNFGQ